MPRMSQGLWSRESESSPDPMELVTGRGRSQAGDRESGPGRPGFGSTPRPGGSCLREKQPPSLHAVRVVEPRQVHPRGNRRPLAVAGVPSDLVFIGGLEPMHPVSEGIVELEPHHSGGGQAVGEQGAAVEGVGGIGLETASPPRTKGFS